LIWSGEYIRKLNPNEQMNVGSVVGLFEGGITRETSGAIRAMVITASAGVDVVLDMVAGPYMQKNIDVLARDGRYIIIAFLGGPSAELNLRAVLGKRLTITGSTLRPQTIEEKAEIAHQLEEKVLPLLESGAVRPIIFQEFPLADASHAHALMESSEHMGKIVLKLS
jgi:NADPH2:quinone reductase